jgi:hypothetical protein
MVTKKFKRFERHFLIGLVVLLLASFSVTGALTFCEDRSDDGSRLRAGGTFEVVPGDRVEVSDAEFADAHMRRRQFLAAVRTPTLELYPFTAGLRMDNPYEETWLNLMSVRAAEASGYRVGEEQLKQALRDLIGGRGSARGQGEFTNAAYQRFLRDEYRGGTQGEFEAELKRLLLRDAFVTPLVRTAAYAVGYADAYEEWKRGRVQVDLEYVALPAAGFAATVEQEERTRAAVGAQVERLQNVNAAARMLRTLRDHAEIAKKTKGAWPADLEALAEGAPAIKDQRDPWGQPLRYTVTDSEMALRSAGADGEMDTADDVTLGTLAALQAHGALRRVGMALVTWHKATGAWPEGLPKLLEKPGADLVPPLQREKEFDDGWGRRVVYVAAEGGASARLTSLGADGEAGTDDDLVIEVTTDDARVVPSGPLVAAAVVGAEDAWGRPLDIRMQEGDAWMWLVSSAGADGEAGTADDLDTGNEQELAALYTRDKALRQELRTEARRRFELLYVHLPMIDDAMLATLWERFPAQRPTSEEELYREWLTSRDPFYLAEDPADPATGYGAVRMKRIAPEAPLTPVPSAATIPAPLGDAGDAPATPTGPTADDAALRETYRTKGWREIMVRSVFVERILAHLLETARTRAGEIAAWDKKHGPSAPPAPEGVEVPPRPEPITFGDLFAEKLADVQPDEAARAAGAKGFVLHVANEPVTDAAWEANPDFGGFEVRIELDRLQAGDRYAAIPTQMGGRTTKLIVHNLEYLPSREPALDEVREQVFERYLGTRRVDRAQKELEQLRTDVLAAGDVDRDGAFERALGTWAGRLGADVTWFREGTGWFLGHGLTVQEVVPDDADDAEKARLRRINFVLRRGYETVGPTPDGVDPGDAEAGKLGRVVLRDLDQGTAVLVRVRDMRHASPEAFSPARYVEFLRDKAYGPMRRTSGAEQEGAVQAAAKRFFGDMAWMRQVFSLRTNTDLDSYKNR